MSKGARIKNLRAEKRDRAHTVVSKETDPKKMSNPGNAMKAEALAKQKKREKEV